MNGDYARARPVRPRPRWARSVGRLGFVVAVSTGLWTGALWTVDYLIRIIATGY